MILAMCQHNYLKHYNFQSEFRTVVCCLVFGNERGDIMVKKKKREDLFRNNGGGDEAKTSHGFADVSGRIHYPGWQINIILVGRKT